MGSFLHKDAPLLTLSSRAELQVPSDICHNNLFLETGRIMLEKVFPGVVRSSEKACTVLVMIATNRKATFMESKRKLIFTLLHGIVRINRNVIATCDRRGNIPIVLGCMTLLTRPKKRVRVTHKSQAESLQT